MVLCQLPIEFRQKEYDKDTEKVEPLDDILFDVIPEWKNVEWILEIWTDVGAFITLLCMLKVKEKDRFLQHGFITGGIVYLMRGSAVLVTPLPNPNTNCTSNLDPDLPTVVTALIVTLKIQRCCHDIFFSGHTMILIVSASLLWTYGIASYKIRKVVIFLYVISGLYLLISTRIHYTIDILIAVYITFLVFYLLHFISGETILKNCNGRSGAKPLLNLPPTWQRK